MESTHFVFIGGKPDGITRIGLLCDYGVLIMSVACEF